MCNYALEQLSELDIPGLPQFQNDRQIVFACPMQHDSLPPPQTSDVIMVRWDELKRERSADQTVPYSESYKSDICTRKTGLSPSRVGTLLAVEMSRRSKKDPRIHAMIRAEERMRSYDMTHTMNLIMFGTCMLCLSSAH
jgi:hypothetical protein